MRDLTLTYARRRNVVRRRATYGLPSRFLDEIPREHSTARTRSAAGRPRGRRARASRGGAAAGARPGAPTARAEAGGGASFRLGDDVVHAAFGEGVVTGVEPGGIVVVRFGERRVGAQADGRLRADHEALMCGLWALVVGAGAVTGHRGRRPTSR